MDSERQLEVNCEQATWDKGLWELRNVTWSLITVPHSTNVITGKMKKQVSQEARRGGHHARLLFTVLASWVHTQGSSQAPPWGHSVSTKGVPVLRVFSVQRVGIDRAQALCPRTSCVLGGRERKEWACRLLNLFLN